jgi:8-amino-3,8-dideoxy-alpha-D-manno-octulosonate transaminase
MNKNWQLAVDGAAPTVRSQLPPACPGGFRIDSEEEEAVLRVLRSKRLFRYYGAYPGASSQVDVFENLLANHLKVKHALGVNSGTSALSCALTAMGVGPGDEVIIPSYTWLSSATSVISVGAVPILAEIDESLNIDPNDLEEKRSEFTKLILPVHMCGAPCDMDALLDFAGRYNLLVLEDVAQAMGGTYKGKPLGSLGDAGIFSFQWNKLITSGEGGALVTNSKKIFERALLYHDVAGAFRVSEIELSEIPPGNVYRMSELQGAILTVQMKRIDSMLVNLRQHKHKLIEQIKPVLDSKGVKFRKVNDREGDTATDIFLIFSEDDINRIPIIAGALRMEGVPVVTFSNSMHVYSSWSPLFAKTTWTKNGGPWRNHPREIHYSPTMCPRTLKLMSTVIKITLSPDMTVEQREQVGSAIEKVIRVAL